MNRERSWHRSAPLPRRRRRTRGKSCFLLAWPCHFSIVMSLFRVMDAAMARATGGALGRMAAIGAAGDHRLAHLAARFLHLPAGAADLPSRLALGLHGVVLRLAHRVADGFGGGEAREGKHKCG